MSIGNKQPSKLALQLVNVSQTNLTIVLLRNKIKKLEKEKRILHKGLKDVIKTHRMYDAWETAKEAIEKIKKH